MAVIRQGGMFARVSQGLLVGIYWVGWVDLVCWSQVCLVRFSGLGLLGLSSESGLLGQVCWIRFAGLYLQGQVCWVSFAWSGLLGQVCWVRFAG